MQIGDLSATGCWSEADRKRSSTWREIRGTKLVLQSLVDSLKGKKMLHRTDNQNTVRILSVGSRKQGLHQDAIDIYKLCQENNIRFFGFVQMIMYEQTLYHEQRMQMTINWPNCI